MNRTSSPGRSCAHCHRSSARTTADHRVAAGRRVVGQEHHRLPARRHLHRAEHHPLAGSSPSRRPRQLGARRSRSPIRFESAVTAYGAAHSAVERVAGEPVVARPGRTRSGPGGRGRGRVVRLRLRPCGSPDRQHVAVARPGAARPRPACRSTGSRAPARRRCRRRRRRRTQPGARPDRAAARRPAAATPPARSATASPSTRDRARRRPVTATQCPPSARELEPAEETSSTAASAGLPTSRLARAAARPVQGAGARHAEVGAAGRPRSCDGDQRAGGEDGQVRSSRHEPHPRARAAAAPAGRGPGPTARRRCVPMSRQPPGDAVG